MAIGEPRMWWENQTFNPFTVSPFTPPVGWQCPVCGAVYAPTVLKCFTKHRKPKDEGMSVNEIKEKYSIDLSVIDDLESTGITTTS
jgi:hypothetical protein